ncbi:putative chitinase 1 [Mytilus trossulus]|uniref:putative chitinase 1 n=1 Tax=Mytilus trossulus TaxID=6551 RepID=UPI003006358D
MELRMQLSFICQIILASIIKGYDIRRVCYFSGSSIYRDGVEFSLKPSDIDPFLCTHLIYASAALNDDGSAVKLPDGYDDFQQYRDLTNLMNINEDLTVMLSIGGWELGSQSWSKLVSSRTNMELFALEVIRYLRMHNFDGLDVDWEYPATRGSPPGDKHNFAELLEVLQHYFEKEEEPDNKETLFLSVCLDPTQQMIDRSYDLKRISRVVNFINLKLYDLYGHWDDPMRIYPHSALTGESNEKNVNSLLNNWISQGVPKHKIVLGIPFFGRSFRLQNSNLSAPGSLAIGPGSDNGDGYPVKNLCHLIKHGGLSERMYARVPFVVHEDEWISYDNPASVQEKAELVMSNRLGGAFVWTLDMDDFNGACGTKYPMMFAVIHGLREYDEYITDKQEAMLFMAEQKRLGKERLSNVALEKRKAGHMLDQLNVPQKSEEKFFW